LPVHTPLPLQSEVEFGIFANILHYKIANLHNCKVTGQGVKADIAISDEYTVTNQIPEPGNAANHFHTDLPLRYRCLGDEYFPTFTSGHGKVI